MIIDKTKKGVNFGKIIENKSELKLYKRLMNEILEYIKINNSVSFIDILRDVGGSDRRILRLLDELVDKKIISYKNSYCG